MENYKKKPDEIEFMAKYSQAKSKEEKTRLKEEYEKELDAYFDLNDTGEEINAMERWDSSREKAQELSLDQWPPETLAMPMRYASDRRSAMECLREISKASPFTSLSGLPARLSRRSLGKLVSRAALANSYCEEAHYFAAANIDKLYTRSIEPWLFELNPNKDNTGLKARRYLYAPMEYGGKIAVVKITVKEYEDSDLENKLYSIEAIGVDLRT